MKGIKVYVTTIARPFQPEQFVAVYGTFKEAENSLRKDYPHMRKCQEGNVYSSDKDSTYLLFIHEREV